MAQMVLLLVVNWILVCRIEVSLFVDVVAVDGCWEISWLHLMVDFGCVCAELCILGSFLVVFRGSKLIRF